MTCAEYGALATSEERNDAIRPMLRAHDLDYNAFQNLAGAQDAIGEFCGAGNWMHIREAGQNLDQPIENAIDWDSDYW